MISQIFPKFYPGDLVTAYRVGMFSVGMVIKAVYHNDHQYYYYHVVWAMSKTKKLVHRADYHEQNLEKF